jgi:hypothetical protein
MCHRTLERFCVGSAAETEEIARDAVKAIRVEYDELPVLKQSPRSPGGRVPPTSRGQERQCVPAHESTQG